ncbi:hypothetical protein OOT08_17000, partial [Leucobacter sp. M11]|nr:hypothetical protein [Leucobacter sp. M11]
ERGAPFPIETHGFETAGFGQPLVMLLAALITGTEFLNGQLRTSLLATPRRGQVLGAKLLVIGVLAALIGAVAVGAAVLLKHGALGEHGLSPGEFTPRMAWNLLGVSANYALIALVAAGVTVISRRIIVTLVLLVPLVLGLTISLLPAVPLLRFLPDLAGIQLLMAYPSIGLLDPLPGGLVMALWALTLTGIAWALFRNRDAHTG